MKDTDSTHADPAAAGRSPLRVLGTVALLASAGTLAVNRLVRRRRDAALADHIRAEFDRLEAARRDLEHRIGLMESRAAADAEVARVSTRVTGDLDSVRHAITDLLRRADAARTAYPHPPQDAAA